MLFLVIQAILRVLTSNETVRSIKVVPFTFRREHRFPAVECLWGIHPIASDISRNQIGRRVSSARKKHDSVEDKIIMIRRGHGVNIEIKEPKRDGNQGNCVTLFRFGPRCSLCMACKKGLNCLKRLKPESNLDKNPFPVFAGLTRRRKRSNPASGTANPKNREDVCRKLNFLLSKAVEYLMFATSNIRVCRYTSLRASNWRFRSSSSLSILRILTIHDPC